MELRDADGFILRDLHEGDAIFINGCEVVATIPLANPDGSIDHSARVIIVHRYNHASGSGEYVTSVINHQGVEQWNSGHYYNYVGTGPDSENAGRAYGDAWVKAVILAHVGSLKFNQLLVNDSED